MNFTLYIEKGKKYWEYLKVHSFGNSLMRKRSVSTLERLIMFASISVFSLIVLVFFVIVPGVNNILTLLHSKESLYEKIYGVTGQQGLIYIDQQKQKLLQEKEIQFKEEQKLEIDKYNQAILKDANMYDIAVLLEDYALTFHTEDKPLVVNNITFGKIEPVKLSLKDLKQDVSRLKLINDVEYRVIPLTVSVEATKEKFEQFLDFIYHSGDTNQFYFKGKAVPVMSIESLNLPGESEKNPVQMYSLKLNLYFQKEELLKKSVTQKQ